MLVLLLESIQSESAEIEGADAFWSMAERRQNMEEVPSVTEALTLRQEWTDATDRAEERRKTAGKLNGEARFEAQQEWHNAMLELALVQQAVLNAMAEAELDMERLVTSEEESLATSEKTEEGQDVQDQQDGRLDLTEVADDGQEEGGLELERMEAERLELNARRPSELKLRGWRLNVLKRSGLKPNGWKQSGSKRNGWRPSVLKRNGWRSNGWRLNVLKRSGWRPNELKPRVLKRSGSKRNGWRRNGWRRSALKPSELSLNGPWPNWTGLIESSGEGRTNPWFVKPSAGFAGGLDLAGGS